MSDKKRKYRAAKIAETIITMAEVVVAAKSLDGEQTTIGEYLSGLLEGPVGKDFDKGLKRLGQHRDKLPPAK